MVEDGEELDAELGGVEGGGVGDGDADGFDGLAVEGVVLGVFGDRFGGGGEGDAGDVAGCEGLGYVGGFEPGGVVEVEPAPKKLKGWAVPRPTEMLVSSMRPRAG